MKVLIIGLGSIAKKHIKILKKINPSIEFYALRNNRVNEKYNNVNNLFSLKNIDEKYFSFVLIASPSYLHQKQITILKDLRIPIFVEKPLCINKNQLEKIEKLDKTSLIYVAYNLRFHPLLIFIKNYLNEESKILEVNCYSGSFLPDWRETNHKLSYSSHKNQGGGVSLDLSHEIDYLLYLFGYPLTIQKNLRKISNITVDSEDFTNLYLEFKEFSATINLNYFRKDPKRTLEIVTSKKSILVDFVSNSIMDLTAKSIIYKSHKDLMKESYINQMNYWLKCLEEKQVTINGFEEAKRLAKYLI